MSLCECGCGLPVKKRFRHGHWARVRPLVPREDRFWQKVDKGSPDGCWTWTASCNPGGYGWLWDSQTKRMELAHRVAYELQVGPIPDGLLVLHHCDNPPCCNAGHLFVGTAEDNMQDCFRKNRNPRAGERNGRSRLTDSDVQAIRESFTGAYGQIADLARRYGISHGAMSHVLHGRSWA